MPSRILRAARSSLSWRVFSSALLFSGATALAAQGEASLPSSAPLTSTKQSETFALKATGVGFSIARADLARALASNINWPRAVPLPVAVKQSIRITSSRFAARTGEVALEATASRKTIAESFESLVASERAALAAALFLFDRATPEQRLSSVLFLRETLDTDGRIPLVTLLAACRSVSGCQQESTAADLDVRAERVVAQAIAETEFMYAPEDDTARGLLDAIDSSARRRGFSVREPSVTNLVRQLRTRCQKIAFPSFGAENVRMVEYSCEAEALVRGEPVAALRFVGRGQDTTVDDAAREATRRFVLEEVRFVGAK